MRQVMSWIDLVLFTALVAVGLWVIWFLPLGSDAAAAATLAGALFGAAAVLLGNLINRINERYKRASENEAHRAKLKALIAAELLNVMNELVYAKELMDSAIVQIHAGGPSPGQIDMKDYMPSGMLLTEGFGAELLLLDQPAIDALTTLIGGLEQTRRAMERRANLVKNTMGLSLLVATELSNSLGHDMTVLKELFKLIAPQRTLLLEEQNETISVTDYLAKKARPPKLQPDAPQE